MKKCFSLKPSFIMLLCELLMVKGTLRMNGIMCMVFKALENHHLLCIMSWSVGEITMLVFIDLQQIERCDENLEKFASFSEKIPENSCLVIDHVTILNDYYREKIYKIVKKKVSRFIVIETGLTACAHTGSIDCGRELQLDEDSFLMIWNGTLKMKGCQEQSLAQKGKEVYEEFSKLFIMSPRLLHEVMDYMFSYRSLDKKVTQVLWQYIKIKQAEIAGFKGCGENKTYAKLILHTTLLLEHIPDDGPYIFTTEQARKVMIPVNIFETEYCIVTKDDMNKYAELSKLGLDKGDSCIKVWHLQPFLAGDWKRKWPYKFEELVHDFADDEIFPIMFQAGGARKEFEKLLLLVQKIHGIALVPKPCYVTETVYEPSNARCPVQPRSGWHLINIPPEHFFMPQTEVLVNLHEKDIPDGLKGVDRNVALFAMYMKKNLIPSHDSFVVYPKVYNFMGIDYFVYEKVRMDVACSSAKMPKTKEDSILYLIQVATGASQKGDTMGHALNVVKNILSDVNITFHFVVLTVLDNEIPYCLTKSRFETITVLNLYENKSTAFQLIMQSNKSLYKFYSQLVKCNVE